MEASIPRPGTQFGGFADYADLSPVQYRQIVAELFGLFHIMGGDEYRHAVITPQIQQPIPHCAARNRIQPDGRFVQKQDCRTMQHGLGKLQPAYHAAGIRANQLVCRINQPHEFECVNYAPPPLLLGDVIEFG